ncbi:ubiquitin family protein, partial [Striga asiatica]
MAHYHLLAKQLSGHPSPIPPAVQGLNMNQVYQVRDNPSPVGSVPAAFCRLLQNPIVAQITQSLLSNPRYMEQVTWRPEQWPNSRWISNDNQTLQEAQISLPKVLQQHVEGSDQRQPERLQDRKGCKMASMTMFHRARPLRIDVFFTRSNLKNCLSIEGKLLKDESKEDEKLLMVMVRKMRGNKEEHEENEEEGGDKWEHVDHWSNIILKH